jgi:hypothetical protein
LIENEIGRVPDEACVEHEPSRFGSWSRQWCFTDRTRCTRGLINGMVHSVRKSRHL